MEPQSEYEENRMVGKTVKQTYFKSKKMESSIVDAFDKLRSDVESVRISAGTVILKHLLHERRGSEDGVLPEEAKHALSMLVRGVGSPRLSSRTGFFSTLVGFLSLPGLSVQDVLATVKKELSAGGNVSKSEVAECFTGQILVGGALIHSDLLFRGSPEEQREVLDMMVAAGKKRSYLHLAVLSFLIDLMNKLDEKSFRAMLWPVLKRELKLPWPEQTLETLHCLLVTRSRYPAVVKRKYLRRFLGTDYILHEDNIEPCSKLLLNPQMKANISHPVYKEFCRQLVESQLLFPFWKKGLEPQMKLRPNRNKSLAALEMLAFALKFLPDKNKIPKLLTHNLVESILRAFTIMEPGNDVPVKARQVFMQMATLLEAEEVTDKTRLSVLRDLLFYPGDFLFEKITGTKLIQLLTATLQPDSVKQLAGEYRQLLTAEKPKVKGPDGETLVWTGQERLYAAQMLTRLMARAPLLEDLEWKMTQLKFLFEIGFFVPTTKAGETNYRSGLAAGAKECFFRALDQRLPRLELLRSLLSSMAHHINAVVFSSTEPPKLRQPLSEKSQQAWHKMMILVQQLEARLETEKDLHKSSAIPVFHILFLHMGLQLFQDAALAEESLEELHSCYERIESGNKKSKKSEEPHWVEVAVDLFLSLLSHNSHLLRSMVGCVFPHLCPHLTATAVHQILQVLDPNAKQNPLSTSEAESDEDDSDSEEEEDESTVEAESDEESDMSDIDDGDDDKEDVNLQLKMAVRKALGEAAETDVESVDMDEINEEEGKRMDTALSAAFKMLKTVRPDKKKQSKDDKALTHFRIRVVDLLEVYLSTEPSLAVCLDMLMPLFALLEFCIRDEHQKPLENRVRSCLKKLSSLRKFSSTEGVDQQLLADILKCLLDKGEKTAVVYQDMGGQVTLCCTFLARCSQHLQDATSSPVELIYKEALVTFFKKRDSLLPSGLFKAVLQISWDGSWSLASLLVDFVFNSEVRPFRKIQALDLLQTFFRDHRLLTDARNAEKLAALEKKFAQLAVKLLTDLATEGGAKRAGVKQKFVQELFLLLQLVKKLHTLVETSGISWKALRKALERFRDSPHLPFDVRTSFNRLASVLGFSAMPKKEKKKKIKDTQELKEEIADINEPEENGDTTVGDVPDDGSSEDETEVVKKEKKQQKKEKKKREKKRFKDMAALKKRSQQLRLDTLSEGLDSGISFAQVGLDSMEVENDSGTEDSDNDTKKKKKKKKRQPSEVLVNGDATSGEVSSVVSTPSSGKKSKKRKLDSSVREHSKTPKKKKS